MRQQLDRLLDDALGDDPRLAIASARQLRAECVWIEQRAVGLARRCGYDWGRIGRLLGISRQSARSRFARVLPTVPPSQRVAARSHLETDRERLVRAMNEIREQSYRDGLTDDDTVAW